MAVKMSLVFPRAVLGIWVLGLLASGSPLALAQTTHHVRDASEICSAMQSAQPGDTLLMLNDGNWTNQDITFEGRGTPEQPISLRAETPGQVILRGNSRLRIGGEYLVVGDLHFKEGSLQRADGDRGLIAVVEFRTTRRAGDPCRQTSQSAHHSRLTNSVVEHYDPMNRLERHFWVLMDGTDNRVDNSTFKGKTNDGAVLNVVRPRGTTEAQNHQIDHNHFLDRPPAPGTPPQGGETIVIGESETSLSDSFTTVESNLFERSNGEIETVSSKSGRNQFRYNTFVSSEGTLTLRHGNAALVEGNFFFGNDQPDTGGVRVVGEDHTIINNYFAGIAGAADNWRRGALSLANGQVNPPLNGHAQVRNALVAFNTLVTNAKNIVIGDGRSAVRNLPPTDSVIANNIVFKGTAPGPDCLVNVVQEPINMRYEGNIMYGPEACLGIPPVPGEVDEIDPELVLDETGLYRPAGTSPAIDRAAGDYPDVTTDMDGQPRDALKDVGADELSEAPITRRPLTPQDVGAPWFRQSLKGK